MMYRQTSSNRPKSAGHLRWSCQRVALLAGIFLVAVVARAQGLPSLTVRVLDEQDRIIVGARVTITDRSGNKSTAVTSENAPAAYYPRLAAGAYRLQATASRFTDSESVVDINESD